MPSDLLSLLTWSTRPDIAAWLAYFRTTKDHARRELALTKLESLVKTSDSPVEQRRAATTLLRALDHKWPADRARAPVNPDREAEGSPRREATRNHRSPSPAVPSSPPVSRVPSAVSRPPTPSPPSPPTPPSPPSPPLPPPSITPSLSHTPTTIAATLARDLSLPDPTQAFITLRAISTDAANEEDLDPLLARIESHLKLPADINISDPDHSTPPGYQDGCRILISHPSRRPIVLELLKLPGQPWLLDLFDTG